MLETPHVLVGAAIVYKIPNPLISIPAAFLSHFILDELPHWNPHLGNESKKLRFPFSKDVKIIVVDSVTALLSGTFIALTKLPDAGSFLLVMLGCFLSVLPDVVEAPFFFLNFDRQWIRSWLGFQREHQNNTRLFWGLFTQVVVILAALFWIFG